MRSSRVRRPPIHASIRTPIKPCEVQHRPGTFHLATLTSLGSLAARSAYASAPATFCALFLRIELACPDHIEHKRTSNHDICACFDQAPMPLTQPRSSLASRSGRSSVNPLCLLPIAQPRAPHRPMRREQNYVSSVRIYAAQLTDRAVRTLDAHHA